MINRVNNNFKGLSINNNYDINNFNNAFFKKENILSDINVKNDGNLLHNNIKTNILEKNIIEYRINIDSIDRNIDLFPDPFHFDVTFNPIIDNRNQTSSPFVLKEFKNVKYIKLDTVILPRHNSTDDNCEYYSLLDDRFVILSLGDIGENRTTLFTQSNNRNSHYVKQNNISNSFAHITPDKMYGSRFYTGSTCFGYYVFKDSHLGNINSLKINF